MRTRVAIAVAAVMGALLTVPAQAQTQARTQPQTQPQTPPRPAASLATCQHHETRSTDCHIHDRKTYIDMSANRPDERLQPHAAEEFREHDRREFLQQSQ
jgi:hypothetical protein